MFPHKIFKRALRRTFPKVFDGSPDDPYFVYAFRLGSADITLESGSSLSWVSIDLHGPDKGYATLWEGSAR